VRACSGDGARDHRRHSYDNIILKIIIYTHFRATREPCRQVDGGVTPTNLRNYVILSSSRRGVDGLISTRVILYIIIVIYYIYYYKRTSARARLYRCVCAHIVVIVLCAPCMCTSPATEKFVPVYLIRE